ncbi:MAG: hypothetical protein KAW12_21925 [Candidatus Aminicenantes bacterium]|nr:hypothetical protein [Candidatus Aminicenantes bacterium]
MHILVNGLLKIDGKSGNGLILLTSRSAFFLRPISDAAQSGAFIGGVIGALIGGLIDKKKAAGMKLEHMDDSEVQELDEKSKKAVSKATLVKKLDLGSMQQVSPTFWGMKFIWPGIDEIDFKGKSRKKKMLAFLRQVGVQIVE